MKELDNLKDLEEISKPLIEFLKQQGDSYHKLIISVDSIELVSTGCYIPLKED